MSIILKLSGQATRLTSDFNPPIVLDEKVDYGIGLTSFETYHAIPNIIENLNNKFYYGNSGDAISIPTGSYELESIEKFINEHLPIGQILVLQANNNTLKCHVKCTSQVDFTRQDSIGSILGFSDNRLLTANVKHVSDKPVQIIKVNAICVDCNIAVGSYENGKPGHLIHHFFPLVPVGAKIVESPEHVIYLPVNTKTITNIAINIVDQDGELLNLRGETVTVGLHLKPFH